MLFVDDRNLNNLTYIPSECVSVYINMYTYIIEILCHSKYVCLHVLRRLYSLVRQEKNYEHLLTASQSEYERIIELRVWEM